MNKSMHNTNAKPAEKSEKVAMQLEQRKQRWKGVEVPWQVVVAYAMTLLWLWAMIKQ